MGPEGNEDEFMDSNFTPVGTEVQVNQTIVNYQGDPDVAAMTDGRFAVVYTTYATAPTYYDIHLQFVNSDGTLSGDEVIVEDDNGTQEDQVVTARSGGGATVVWEDEVSDEIHFATVSSVGVVGIETTVMDGSTRFYNPDAAALADDRVLVVVSSYDDDYDISFNFINAAGTVTSTTPGLLDDGTGYQFDARVAAFGNNALVVYWDGTVGTDGAIVARFYDGTGSAASDFSTEVVVSTGGDPVDPDVAALTDGRYIVVWTNNDNDDLDGRFVDATGTPVGAVFEITNLCGDNDDARVAALPDGGFMVTWENDGGLFPTEDNSYNDAVVARRFDANGDPAGDLFLVNTGDPATDQSNPAIAVKTNGEALIAWDDEHSFAGIGQDNDPTGVRAHAFKTETDLIVGTDANDVLNGYSLDEAFSGLKGKDVINGAAGSDLINGGKGSDDLTGGAGADAFVFDNKKSKDTVSDCNKKGKDTVSDWEDGDELHFDNAVFKKLGDDGALKSKFFHKGAEAADDNDFLVYNKAKGKLFYDSNGDGDGKEVLILKLDKGSDLGAGDIFMI